MIELFLKPALREETDPLMTTYEDRQILNDMSRSTANHHSEPWSSEETALLRECWGEVPLEEISETLGRTIEACRQRYYYPQGQHKEARPHVHQSGWLIGFCSSCGRFTDVYCTGIAQDCEDCR
jgi:hypothetical protein